MHRGSEPDRCRSAEKSTRLSAGPPGFPARVELFLSGWLCPFSMLGPWPGGAPVRNTCRSQRPSGCASRRAAGIPSRYRAVGPPVVAPGNPSWRMRCSKAGRALAYFCRGIEQTHHGSQHGDVDLEFGAQGLGHVIEQGTLDLQMFLFAEAAADRAPPWCSAGQWPAPIKAAGRWASAHYRNC